jgi:hypothetical protein
MPKAFFKMSRCRVMNSSSRRNRAISSALAGSLARKAPRPVGSPIGNSLLQRFKLQTDTPSSWLNCWPLRSPDFNILTASRLNSSSNRRPCLFVPLFSFFSTFYYSSQLRALTPVRNIGPTPANSLFQPHVCDLGNYFALFLAR